MSKKILFSIITVTLNMKKELISTINSVKSSKFKDFEHIIVDGGSTDGTIDYLKKNNDNNLLWISEKDDGIFDAMNKGIGIAKGEWIVFINTGDKILDNNILLKTSSIITPHCNDIDLFYGQTKDIDPDNGYSKITGHKIRNINSFYWNCPIRHPSTFVKRSVYESLGCYNVSFKLVADYDWFYNFFTKYFDKCYFLDFPLIEMSVKGATSSNLWINFIERFQIAMKRGPLWVKFIFIAISPWEYIKATLISKFHKTKIYHYYRLVKLNLRGWNSIV